MPAAIAPRALIELPSDQDSSGRTFGAEELKLLAEAIHSGTLTSTKGRFVRTLEREFAALVGVNSCYACSSGSAAVHAAVAAIDPEPGDEIITSPITDMGALTPILYQGAIPVFADVDPRTGNVTAETIADRYSDRTRAVIVTHLFGQPCEMKPILASAASRGVPVIEDCAQAFLAEQDGKIVGTIGALGCFSLQQGKHITTGEGGLVTTDDSDLARRVFLFVNKAWGYGDPQPDHYFLSLNYRLSELQGAVAVAQMAKLVDVVSRRRATAAEFTSRIGGLPGIETPSSPSGSKPSWWKYAVLVDPAVVAGGAVGLARRLKEKGIVSAPRYIQKPAFDCAIFRDQRTFGRSRWPFPLARPEAVDYEHARFPGALRYLARVLVLPWNENYTQEHLDYLVDSISAAAAAEGERGDA